jgi:uncharacterized protein
VAPLTTRIHRLPAAHQVKTTKTSSARNGWLSVDKRLLSNTKLSRAGSLLHDIRVYRLYNEAGELDHANYIRHGVLGHALLREEGFPEEICRFASHHTGVGLTREDVLRQRLPLPPADYVAETSEEALVMYADKFHSKTSPPTFLTAGAYAASVRRFGADKVAAFESMRAMFGEPDLAPFSRAYGHRVIAEADGEQRTGAPCQLRAPPPPERFPGERARPVLAAQAGSRHTGAVIRLGTLADLPAANKVFRNASLSNASDRDNLLAHPEYLILGPEGLAEGRTYVAEEDGSVAGFATWTEALGTTELEDLFVHPGWMRRGIATALVQRIAQVLRARGVQRLEVTANPDAMGFYRAVGFLDCGVAETYFGTAPRMVLALR